MQMLSEMAVPFLPIGKPAFDRDPMSFLAEARAAHPWIARFSEGYFIHGYDAVKDLTAMDHRLRPSFDGVVAFYGAHGTAWGDWMENHVIAISGPRHKRIRDSVARAFTPAAVNRLRGIMRLRIAELLDEWVPHGQLDFSDLAALFPISVLCSLLGASTLALPRIQRALETQGRVFSLDRALLPELLAGHDVMVAYIDALVARHESRERGGEELLLDALIAAKHDGRIDDVELRDLLLVLFPAGYDTSKNLLTFLVYRLIEHPILWQRCAQDLQYCTKVTEEMLRHSSVASVFRTVAEEFVYDDVLFPKNARLFFNNTLAGRDPDVFADGDDFDPDRKQGRRHLAFGRGAHICIGQYLARVQVSEAIHLITGRIRNPRLAGEVKWRSFLGTWGPSTLPIEFDPA